MIRLEVRWWRWVISVVGCVHNFLVLGPLFNYNILFVSFQREFNSGAVLAGWPGSLGTALACLASPFTAVLVPRVKGRTLVMVGYGIVCAGLILTSVVPSLAYAILTYGVFVGVGTNFVLHTSIGMVIEWFRRNGLGRANAIAALGSSLGLLAFSPLITFCINHFGWRQALRYISGGILVLGVTDSLFITDPPTTEYDLEKRDLRDDEKCGEDRRERVVLKQVRALESDLSSGRNFMAEENRPCDQELRMKHEDLSSISHRVESEWEIFHMMKHIDTWAWTIGAFLSVVGWTFSIVNFASFMDRRGLNSDQIPIVIMCFALGEICGKLLLCVVGDCLPFQRVYLLASSLLMATIALGVMAVAQTFPQMVALSIISGLLRSALFGTSNAVVADLFSSSYSSNGVTVLCIFPYGFGMLLGGPLSGGLYDITGDYTLSLVVIAIIFACSSAAVLSIPIRRRMKSRGVCCYQTTPHAVVI